MDTLRSLRRMLLFAGLSRRELEAIAQITTQQQYERNQVIIEAGERGTAVFLLTSGAVRISVQGQGGREIILGVLYPDDSFGEMSLLDGLPRSATVTAVEESEVLVISRKDFLQCIEKAPQVAVKIIVTLSLRLRRMNQKVWDLASLRAPQRVARILVELAQAHDQGIQGGISMELPFTHRELAALAGVSRETFTRLLIRFQQRGLLTIERRKLFIPDLAKLEELA